MNTNDYKLTSPWRSLCNDEIFKRSCFAFAIHENRYIFVAGGYHRGEGDMRVCLTSAYIFDSQTKTHIKLPDLPHGMWPCGGAIINGYFYIVGRGKIYRMSLSKRSLWELVLSSDFVIFVHNVVSDGEKLYVFNSYHHVGFISYDPSKKSCTRLPRLPKARAQWGHVSAIVGDNIFIIGGCNGCNDSTACTANGHISPYSSSVKNFSISTQQWSEGPSLPKPVYGAAACVIEGRWIVVTGGKLDKCDRSSKSFIYDTLTQKWTGKNVALERHRTGHSCVAIGKQIISIGGDDYFEWINYHSTVETIHKKYIICNWEIIKDFILLRYLVDEGRAHLANPKSETQENGNGKGSKMLEKIMTDMNVDVFMEVLSFLI